MVKIPPDERTVYLAFKDVFKGPDAQLRTSKAIKRRIRRHLDHNEEIKTLVQEYKITSVGNSAKTLLENDIFSSTLKAKIRFPELFDVSPAQSAGRAASEAEAARIDFEAIREVVVGQQDESISSAVDTERLNLETEMRAEVAGEREQEAKRNLRR